MCTFFECRELVYDYLLVVYFEFVKRKNKDMALNQWFPVGGRVVLQSELRYESNLNADNTVITFESLLRSKRAVI